MQSPHSLPVSNQQPTEHVEHGDGQSLDVVEIYHTIQGEGPFTGWPAVFVRLAGCTLQCPMCDTNYTENREVIDLHSLLTAIDALMGERTKLVVITGGEPFRQSIGPLVKALLRSNYKVQIETNGTVYDESMRDNWYNPSLCVVCSPKARVHASLQPHVNALKYIVSAGDNFDEYGLPCHALGCRTFVERPWPMFYGKVYLQPADTGEPRGTVENIRVAVHLCKQYGYILSLQLHKVARIP